MASNDLDMVHVPYKGSTHALPDVVNGSSIMMFDSLIGSMPMVQAGKLRYLAVASESRVSVLPDVPTLAEAGVTGVVANNVFGLFAPKGVPSEVVERLSEALESAVADPTLKSRLASQGSELVYAPADDLAQIIKDEHGFWADVVKKAGLKPQ